MCTSVHLPTMHRHVAVSLLYNPPVLLLQDHKGRKKSVSGEMFVVVWVSHASILTARLNKFDNLTSLRKQMDFPSRDFLTHLINSSDLSLVSLRQS